MRYPILQRIAPPPPTTTSKKAFCDTIGTSITRYEKYRCWASTEEAPPPPQKNRGSQIFMLGAPSILYVGSLYVFFRSTQEGCGGLRGENPAAFPQARPIFQQPFSLPESAQTLAGIAFRAAGKSVRNFPAASKFARKLFQQGILDSHSLLEFSDFFRPLLYVAKT